MLHASGEMGRRSSEELGAQKSDLGCLSMQAVPDRFREGSESPEVSLGSDGPRPVLIM